MLWVARIRRAVLALLVGVLLFQLRYPDAYMSVADPVRLTVMRPIHRREAAVEQAEDRERQLVSAGYEYGLVARRFVDSRGAQAQAICTELGFADADLGKVGLAPDYFDAKLRGMAELREACKAEMKQ